MAACRVAGIGYSSQRCTEVFLAVSLAGGWTDTTSFIYDQIVNKPLVRRRLRALAKRHGIVHRRGK